MLPTRVNVNGGIQSAAPPVDKTGGSAAKSRADELSVSVSEI